MQKYKFYQKAKKIAYLQGFSASLLINTLVEAMGLEPIRKQSINAVFTRVFILRDKFRDKFFKAR